MRLLLVSFAFPPYNSIGAVRVSKTAKYLTRLGHDVRVLTAGAQGFRETLPLELPPERVVYSKWLDLRKLGRGGGAGAAKAQTATAGGGAAAARPSPLRPLKRGLGYLYKTVLDFPDANVGWLPFAVRASSRILDGWRPDLILASSPPPTSLLVAYRLSAKYGVPWVADLRDIWIDHPYYEQPAGRRKIEERLERRVLSSALGFVTVSEPWAETLRGKFKKPTAVVFNGFDEADYPARAEVPFDGGRVRIVYTGIIYPGKRDPSPLFKALNLMGARAERVRVAFYGFYLDSALALARAHGVEHLVEIHDPVPYGESLRLQSEADLLLLLLWVNPKERGVHPAKLYEYIGARRPILAIGGEESVSSELVRERKAGVVMSDPAEIARQLEEWISEKERTGSIARLPDEAAAGVTREEQTRRLEAYLRALLNGEGERASEVA